MLINLLKIGSLLIVIVLPLYFPVKSKKTTVKISKNHNDTSNSQYAINEHGFLEEIHHDDLLSHK